MTEPSDTPAATASILVPVDLLDSLVYDDPCDIDHNGDCQAHGYFGLEHGEVCPQARLKAILAALEGTS